MNSQSLSDKRSVGGAAQMNWKTLSEVKDGKMGQGEKVHAHMLACKRTAASSTTIEAGVQCINIQKRQRTFFNLFKDKCIVEYVYFLHFRGNCVVCWCFSTNN